MTKENNRKPNDTLSFPIGTAPVGRKITTDFLHVPHLLVGGAVGYGKSVFLHVLVCSLVREHSPDEVRFVLIDPKQVEFGEYGRLPHLIGPVVTNMDQAVAAVQWALAEAERRNAVVAEAGCSDIDEFNARNSGMAFPHVVIACDESFDLLFERAVTMEPALLRLAAEGGTAGIHLVLATSRTSGPSNFTDVILSAIPGHMVFKQMDAWNWGRMLEPSDEVVREARALVKRRGDAIWQAPSGERVFIHAPFLPSSDVERIVGEASAKYPGTSEEGPWKGIKSQAAACEAARPGSMEDIEALYARAKQAVQESGLAAAHLLQRRLGVAHSDALWLLALLEARHVIGPERDDGPRGVFPDGK